MRTPKTPRTHNIITRKQGAPVSSVVGNMQKHHTACNRRKTEKGQDRALLLPFGGQPSTAHGGNKLNSTKRYVQQDCVERIEAK
jgi:hypothetical protein